MTVSTVSARAICLCLAFPLAAGCRPQPSTSPTPSRSASASEDSGGRGRGAPSDPDPKPYNKVITPEAETQEGLFRTHRIGSKLYYEIPAGELGEAFLLVTQIAKTTLGAGYGGQAVGNRVLRWERDGHRVFLRTVQYEIVADSSDPIYSAVEAANYDPILAAFNVEAYGLDSAAVIEVTKLFTTDVPELSAKARLRPAGMDPSRASLDASRTFVERVATFPDNIEVEATHTFEAPLPNEAQRRQLDGPPRTTASLLMHWSMVRLPNDPMQPRLYDDRVGYFSIRQQDYGTDEHRVSRKRYITRWRLEKKNPGAELSDPVQPIIYYVDPATPAQWIPWIKRGIEDWQPAFEAAGFTNAIIAKDAPTRAEAPNWSAEDARYSVIRWLPSTIENASGPHVHDPRTGEILESDIQFYHNVMNLLRDWYWTQVGPLDPRAETLPLPDSLMGRLIEYVTAHEVGHTLGFQHNMKASSTYPPDSLRSESFLREFGHTPTLMDYSRFNYVAQPEDSIPPALLIPGIGPYDKFATMWGYKPIPGADTPAEELPTLNEWARRQDEIPYLRFSTSGSNGSDPGALTEAVGDANAVQSTRLGLMNIERLVPMLIPATVKPGEDFEDLSELYGRLVRQWGTELNHVVAIVGGAASQEKYGGQEGVRFTPIARARQAEAVDFLNENAFETPEFLLETEILRRIEVDGAMSRILDQQERILRNLLDEERLDRLIEFEALALEDERAYTVGDLFVDVRGGIWSELDDSRVAIDPFRRALQRSYLELLSDKLNPPAAVGSGGQNGPGAPTASDGPEPSAASAFVRGELVELDAAVRRAVGRASDRSTRLHLQDMRARIENILNPNG
ncbi:MAG: zinc-dependent metalloprotease [Gemmatimonadaceae bacterium]